MCYENTWDQTLSWNSDVHSLNIHVVSASFLAPWSRLSSLGDNWPLYTSIELQWSGITCLLSMRNCYHQLSWSLMPHQNPWDTLNSLGYGWEYKKMCERTRPGLRANCDIGRLVGMNARRVMMDMLPTSGGQWPHEVEEAHLHSELVDRGTCALHVMGTLVVLNVNSRAHCYFRVDPSCTLHIYIIALLKIEPDWLDEYLRYKSH